MQWEDVPVDRLEKYGRASVDDLAVLLATRLRPNSSVLDVGCGGGRHLRYLAELGHRPVGVDPNPGAIKAVQNVLPDIPVYLMSEKSRFPFPDEAFDAILSTYAIYYGLRVTVQSSIRECLRVLRQGGLLFAHLISTKDSKYGIGPEIEPGSFIDSRPAEIEAVRHFFDISQIMQICGALSTVELSHQERPLNERDLKGRSPAVWRDLCSYWVIRASK